MKAVDAVSLQLYPPHLQHLQQLLRLALTFHPTTSTPVRSRCSTLLTSRCSLVIWAEQHFFACTMNDLVNQQCLSIPLT